MATIEQAEIDLVCSVCGSGNDNWPLARCRDHDDKHNPWTPLMSARAWQGRKKLRHSDKPLDLFGGLSVADWEALARPVSLK